MFIFKIILQGIIDNNLVYVELLVTNLKHYYSTFVISFNVSKIRKTTINYVLLIHFQKLKYFYFFEPFI